MPCYRCGARQVDPDRGESPWKRGVRADRQVLVCPACQVSFDWMADLDRCQVCASPHLVRRLGEVECRDCGSVREPAAPASDVAGSLVPGGRRGAGLAAVPGSVKHEPEAAEAPTPGLAEEVERALARVLGRTDRPARIG
jgi:hypothetical protein